MMFEQLQASDRIFLDANILIYAAFDDAKYGENCSKLLEHISKREVRGFTSSHALSNVVHRLMTLEACKTFGWPYAGIARQMLRHPAEVRQLHRYRDSLDGIIGMGIEVWPVDIDDVVRAAGLSASLGLLSNDALAVGLMQSRGVTFLASADSDFDRVPGITRLSP